MSHDQSSASSMFAGFSPPWQRLVPTKRSAGSRLMPSDRRRDQMTDVGRVWTVMVNWVTLMATAFCRNTLFSEITAGGQGRWRSCHCMPHTPPTAEGPAATPTPCHWLSPQEPARPESKRQSDRWDLPSALLSRVSVPIGRMRKESLASGRTPGDWAQESGVSSSVYPTSSTLAVAWIDDLHGWKSILRT